MSVAAILMLLQGVPLAPTVVPDAELAQQRGGFALPNGIDVALTVQTQTTLNGAIVLRTVFRADQGAPTLTIFAPKAGETVSAQGATQTVGTAAATPTITYDPRTGVQVTPGGGSPTVSIVTPGDVDTVPAGLAAVAGGVPVTTDQGVITETSLGGLQTIELKGNDLAITHLAGNAFGSAIANAGNDRAIDTQTTVSIDLRNAGPDVLGSAMLRVEHMGADAMGFRQ